MYITKQIISVSSDTANWYSGKVAARGKTINGALLSILCSDGGSTDHLFRLHRHSTAEGNCCLKQVFPTSAVAFFPVQAPSIAGVGNEAPGSTDSVPNSFSTTDYGVYGSAARHYFADERPYVICSATCKSFTLTLYVEGNASPSGNST